jgi:hypothetical protein
MVIEFEICVSGFGIGSDGFQDVVDFMLIYGVVHVRVDYEMGNTA